MNNISFDLETLGNTLKAPIVQIGACKFDDSGNIDRENSFIRTVKLESLGRYNFDVNYSTIGWWMSQDDKAIKSVFCTADNVDIRLALFDFQKWIGQSSKYYYWSHATFDPPILANNLIETGIGRFIPFRLFRDIRTLVHFAGETTTERNGIHHNALDDAIFQAQYISELLQRMK